MKHIFGPNFMCMNPSGKKSNIGKSEIFCLDKIHTRFLSYLSMKLIILSIRSVKMCKSIFGGIVIPKNFSPNETQNKLRRIQSWSQIRDPDIKIIQFVISLSHH